MDWYAPATGKHGSQRDFSDAAFQVCLTMKVLLGMLLDLLAQIPSGQEITTVTTDGVQDTRKCHDMIAAQGAAAVIFQGSARPGLN